MSVSDDISRRRFISLVGATAAAALTPGLPVTARAAPAFTPPVDLKPVYSALAQRLEPAWRDWEVARSSALPYFDQMCSFAAGGDFGAHFGERAEIAVSNFNG